MSLSAMPRIDAHAHYHGDHPDCVRLLESLQLKVLNICVAHDAPYLLEQAQLYRQLSTACPRHFAWCTSFDLDDCERPDYAERIIAQLDKDFAAGAVGCKIWKNVGMEVRKQSGEFLHLDDPLFAPILAYLEREQRTLLLHMGEPYACWQPLEFESPHANYYRHHPQWHMYNRPGFPSHARIIAARDHVVQAYPGLRVVGAHLGSLEYDLGELAMRLDAFPNFAIDTAARVADLARFPAQQVREFFAAYSDRILFATDVVLRTLYSSLDPEQRQHQHQQMEQRQRQEWAYYDSTAPVLIEGRQVPGLGLDAATLQKYYYGNACHWYPGLG